jgi:hypothetical protein
MRWTRQRFAREVIAGRVLESVSDQQHADERCCCGRQNRVVLTPRRWRQVGGVASARPGLDKTYPLMTVAKEPGHRGERDISRKTIACGNAGRFRCTRCCSCAFYHYQVHTRPRVQRAPGIPHALHGGERFINDSGASRRGVANSCLRTGFGETKRPRRRHSGAMPTGPRNARPDDRLRNEPGISRFRV